MSPFRIMTGGQAGLDRAALDAALASGVPIGGWCPAGRGAEDGPIPARYVLVETLSDDPAERTRPNVRDSDGTLILTRGPFAGGTAFTAEAARAFGRPLLVVDVAEARDHAHVVRTLNTAGPRESEAPGMQAEARALMAGLLDRLLALG